MQKELLSSLENLTKCNLQSIDYFIGKENVIYDFEFNFLIHVLSIVSFLTITFLARYQSSPECFFQIMNHKKVTFIFFTVSIKTQTCTTDNLQ